MEHVAFFKEHTNRDGVRIDRYALQRICDRCNERIRDTGDYPPVVLRHTTDSGDRDPKVIGFAGPFYVGQIGNVKPRAAILGTMSIFAEDAPEAKRYPRLSVEYWASEKDPTNGYFDPISLLGAETPELDLGIRYAKNNDGMKLIRYAKVERFQASCPGGNNTFVPSTDGDEEKKTLHSKESGVMPLTQEDLMQIVEAMKPVMQAMVEDNVSAEDDAVEAEDAEGVDDAEVADEEAEDTEAVDKNAKEEMPEKKVDDKPVAEVSTDDDEKDDKKKAEKYQKMHDDVRTQYAKLQREYGDLKTNYAKLQAEVDGANAEARKAVRYQKLTELNTQGYVFEVADEAAECESMTDEQFSRHCDRVVSRYQRIPMNMIPVPKSPKLDGNTDEEKRARYSKQAREIAAVNREKKTGETDYQKILEKLCQENAA